jgi:autotransporter-associated beta strand protein
MNRRLLCGIALIAIPLIMPAAVSASLIWDSNGATTPNPADGSGTWDNGVTSNWWNTDTSTDVTWTNGETVATIGTGVDVATTRTITIASGGVTAGGLFFNYSHNTKDYTIAGDPLTLSLSSGTPTISCSKVATKWYNTPTISANIQGPSGARTDLNIDGLGSGSALTLSGTNKLGAVHVMSSVTTTNDRMNLYVSSPAALDATSVTMDQYCELRLNGAGTYNVPITLNGYGNAKTSPDTGSAAIFNNKNGTIWSGNITLAGNSSIGSASTYSLTENGVISDGTPSAHYSLAKAGSTNTLVLANSNTYTGDTQIYRGTLELNSLSGAAINKDGGNVVFLDGSTSETLTIDLDEQIGDSAIVDFQNNVTAAFNLNGHTETVAGLTRSGGTSVPTVRNNAATDAKLILSPALGAAYTYSGVLANGSTGKLALQKDGLGSQTLSGTNTYTGDTVVKAGSLAIDGSITSAMDVQGGSLKGHGTITGAVVAASGGSIEPGNSIGTLTIAGNVTLGGTLDVEYDGAAVSQKTDLLAVTGDLNLTGATFAFAPAAGGSPLSGEPHMFVTYTGALTGTAGGTAPAGYQVDYSTPHQISLVVAIPEPATWILLVLGGMALAAYKRRRG